MKRLKTYPQLLFGRRRGMSAATDLKGLVAGKRCNARAFFMMFNRFFGQQVHSITISFTYADICGQYMVSMNLRCMCVWHGWTSSEPKWARRRTRYRNDSGGTIGTIVSFLGYWRHRTLYPSSKMTGISCYTFLHTFLTKISVPLFLEKFFPSNWHRHIIRIWIVDFLPQVLQKTISSRSLTILQESSSNLPVSGRRVRHYLSSHPWYFRLLGSKVLIYRAA